MPNNMKGPTNSSLVNRCKNILATCQIIDTWHPEFLFLGELFKNHPRFETLKGPGIWYFFVDDGAYKKGKSFWIMREDFSSVEISYASCVHCRRSEYSKKKS